MHETDVVEPGMLDHGEFVTRFLGCGTVAAQGGELVAAHAPQNQARSVQVEVLAPDFQATEPDPLGDPIRRCAFQRDG